MSSPPIERADPPPQPLVGRALLVRAGVGICVLFAAAVGAGFLLQDKLEQAGAAFVDGFGSWGLALGVVISDASLMPLTNEPLMALAMEGGMSPLRVFLVTASASVGAGWLGYGGGRLLGRFPPLQRFLNERQPRLRNSLRTHGAKVVAAAALLPIPFSFSTWGAGAVQVAPVPVAIACLLRVPKTGFYLWLIERGLALGGGS